MRKFQGEIRPVIHEFSERLEIGGLAPENGACG